MAEVGIQTLQTDAAAVVAMAAAGEPVTIIDGGQPIVRMVPYVSSFVEELIATGRARAARRRLSDLPFPEPIQPGESSLSEGLEEMRKRERY